MESVADVRLQLRCCSVRFSEVYTRPLPLDHRESPSTFSTSQASKAGRPGLTGAFEPGQSPWDNPSCRRRNSVGVPPLRAPPGPCRSTLAIGEANCHLRKGTPAKVGWVPCDPRTEAWRIPLRSEPCSKLNCRRTPTVDCLLSFLMALPVL